jgi:hypothetical protein
MLLAGSKLAPGSGAGILPAANAYYGRLEACPTGTGTRFGPGF